MSGMILVGIKTLMALGSFVGVAKVIEFYNDDFKKKKKVENNNIRGGINNGKSGN